jgi:hypothetical protein
MVGYPVGVGDRGIQDAEQLCKVLAGAIQRILRVILTHLGAPKRSEMRPRDGPFVPLNLKVALIWTGVDVWHGVTSGACVAIVAVEDCTKRAQAVDSPSRHRLRSCNPL